MSSWRAARWTALLAVLPLATSCLGSAGGETFEFDAYAAGPADAKAGEAYAFRSGRGFDVTLERASMWVGAIYLNRSVATSVSADTSCTLAGIYVAEVTTGRFVDLLSPTPQRFPELGTTTTDRATTAEVWLSSGDVDAATDPTIILDVAGVAERDGATYPFEGRITIGANRQETPSDPAQPGAKPICKERVVSPIPVELQAAEGDALLLRVDPKAFFANVDFSTLEEQGTSPPVYRFRDDGEDQASRNLYGGLRAASFTYSLSWVPEPR